VKVSAYESTQVGPVFFSPQVLFGVPPAGSALKVGAAIFFLMSDLSPHPEKPQKLAYLLFFAALGLIGFLHLMTALVAALFASLALQVLSFGSRKTKWGAIVLLLVLLAALFYGFALFINHAIVVLPDIMATAIPRIVHYAAEHGVTLPFNDTESLIQVVLDSVHQTLGYLSDFAKLATKEFVFVLMGVVIAIGIYVNPEVDRDRLARPLNLYSLYTGQLAELFRRFFTSFEVVMGAQVLISAINTLLTALFIHALDLRYGAVLVMVTFLCGLLPVIGNLISNSVIVSVAFTASPQLAGWTLLFLVFIHKLEYFLNSKIIGGRIRNPMWLTLVALIVGERLFGITGLILAPVILHFIKVEASRFEVARVETGGKEQPGASA